MKLTKKLEAEILKTYSEVWNAYLRGDMRTFASILDESCYIIGSAAGEIFSNKKAAVKYYKATAAQITGKAEFRNRKIKVMPVEKGVMVNENSDFYLLIDDQWTFYGPARISSLFHKKNNKWKVIHQHGSFPDSKTEEGEQVNTDKIKAENIQLRDAVKRRTEELENKNRELEIETALERVRAVAMAMRKPEDLSGIGEILFTELRSLGFADLRNTEIIIISDVKETLTSYYYSDYDVTGVVEVDYKSDPKVQSWVDQLKKANDAFAEIVITEKEIKAWRKYREEVGHLPDPKLNKAKAVYYYSYSIGMGGLSISTFKPASKEHIEILERFRNVFNLSYQRYIDIAKAEAQAKEAQIELALERVRARTMAMQKSDELREAVLIINQQLQELDFVSQACNIIIIDKDTGDEQFWVSGFTQKIFPESYQVPRLNHHYQEDQFTAWRNGVKYAVFEYTGKEKEKFDKIFFTQTDFRNVPEPAKQFMIGLESIKLSTAFTTYGSLQVLGPEPLSEEKATILKRFAKVFEQTYTRFLDLQKAELQVREAQIETGLERVRSKTMAMHKSEEVTGIAVSLNEELLKLGFEGGSTIMIIDKETGDTEQWTGFSEDKNLKSCYVPYFKHPYHDALLDDWKREEKFLVYTLTGEEKKTIDKHYFTTGYKDFPESDKKWMREMGSVTFSHAFMKYGAIHWGPGHLTEEQLKILQRFSKVFEQSYTRFLDLQKAEAQAREAKIEAALERVRSRSMAMHKSDDLHEVIKVVTEQLSVLDLKFNVSNFAKINPDGSWDLWLSTPEQAYPALIHVPYLDHPIFNRITEEEAKGNDFYTDVYTREQTNIFFHHFFENTIARNSPEERKQFVYSSKGLARSVFQTKNIWFSVGRYDITAFIDEENSIFKRFANVFEQAYTRFLDLQKAEAQARETEIELSLERVRAKTMSMQKPSEFADIINVIGEQFVHLGFDIDWVNFGASGFAISEGIDIWNFAVIPGASPISARVFIPYFDHPVFTTSAASINEFTNGGKDFIVVTLDKQTKDTWLDHLFTKTIFKDVPEEYRVIQYAKPGYTTSNISLKDTWLSIGKFDIKNFTDEQHAILRRFANAFGQAYTRFLDLQKAEAQAREAQIEASLERVRSRAMAMQNSDELKELIGTVFTELTKLDIVLTRCLIMIYDPRSNDSVWWMANSEAPTEPIGLRIQNHEHPPYAAYLKAWQEKKLKWVYVLEGAVKKDWDDFLFVETELSHLPDFVIAGMKAPGRVYLNSSFNSFGNLTLASLEPLSNEHFDILLRFAKVFDLTYTRFNDLKQAEAQARESQIELALERVRARTMAMQKSDELAEAAQLLYNEFGTLGINTILCGYMFINEEKNSQTAWTVLPDGTLLPNSMDFPLTGDHVLNKRYEDWKQKKPLHILSIQGEANKEHHRFLSDYVPSFVVENVFSRLPDRIVFHCANFSSGYLLILATDYFSQDDQQTVIRFAKVFEMTYTRFLDLRQAEAQTREAQIELALERVRARTMAMHKSEELAETAQVLFHQLSELGGIPDRIAIGIADEVNGVVNFWTTDQQGSHLDNSFSARLNEKTTIAKTYEAWKEHKKSLVVDLQGEELKEWIKFAREEMGIVVKADQIKDRRVHSLAFFSHGWILATSHELQSTETIQILERFASVFNLTYRRFLDLQKAEAQAREAQIEAALERVRSSSLAMHKSEELKDVVKIVFENFRSLGLQNIDSVNINIFHEGSRDFDLWLAAPGQDYTTNFRLPYLDHPIANDFFNDVKKGETIHKGIYDHDLKNKYFEYMFENSDNKYLPEERKKLILSGRAYSVATGIAKHSSIFIHNYNGEKFSDETIAILVKFSKVFDQAYTRFLDLQKAEANAREAQIEVGLERVRAKAMAMHSSKDLAETLSVFYRELKSLSVVPIRCGVALMDKESRMAELTTMNTTGEGDSIEIIGKIKMAGHPVLDGVFESWLVQKEYHAVLRGNQIKEYYQVLKPQIDYLDYSQDEAQFGYYFMFNEGDVYAWTEKELTEDELTIYRRFTTVISLTYKRYKDLQQAEAQAKEARIEAGLERVRSKTMAMHSSEDVGAATATMFTELEKLGIQNLRGGITIIKAGDKQEVWGVTNLPDGKTIRSIGEFDMHLHPLWRELLKAKLNNGDYNYYRLAGKDKENYINILNATPNYLSQPIKDFPDVHVQSYFFGEGAIWTNSLEPHSDEQMQTMKRFASVFSLTFRRYQDLKKAEAQAKEAQIEAGLERVRSRTMAMHKSDELAETAVVLFKQMIGLGIEPNRLYIAIINDNSGDLEFWITDENGDKVSSRFIVNVNKNISIKKMHEGWVAKHKTITIDMQGKELEDWLTYWKEEFHVAFKPGAAMKRRVQNIAYFSKGFIAIASPEDQPETTINLLERFAAVFNLTYTRFSDLQQAEGQAREATIEAALEKVRGKAIAMQNSNDLSATVSMIISELRKLGITPIRCGVGIINKETHKGQLYTATTSADGDSLSVVGWVLLHGHPVLENIYQKWVEGEDYFPELTGDSMRHYYEQLLAGLSVPLPDFKDEQKHYGHFFAISVGCLYAWSDVKYNDDEIKILKRFATIIDLTFRRYFELQKSEANAREAVKQAALDRVRAEIASMRTINDLDRITPLIWNELTILGIPFIRCGVFIMDEEPQLIHTFLSTPDGKAIAAFHLPYDTPGNLAQVVAKWKESKKYIDHWDESEFKQFAEILMKQGALVSAEQYLKTIPKGGFYLHFLPFLQGMLYVGNTEQLKEEEIELIQHVADAFSTAYARYEDFNKLEAAKQQVEKTLTDLKQAQTQLVQSEKMASLGEMTAGIAHEIQNPLNFVNNFSEVSKELLDEMKTELETGNTEDAKDIADDVIQNLEKINHHGKRADAIVKSMLQHSRSSSGKKEPTDINSLADEYLRLAYHGLRAKDKSFNAKFETAFDDSIGKINIISQDIGRVLVNLINNAFYAVSERKKQESNGYEPTVEVLTKKTDDKIEITVKDNGNGIPKKVLDKIFQPFFTTKPTGQGTGLGLSLAYDIVTKGHGGELKVETKEGEGSEFIIELPASKTTER